MYLGQLTPSFRLFLLGCWSFSLILPHAICTPENRLLTNNNSSSWLSRTWKTVIKPVWKPSRQPATIPTSVDLSGGPAYLSKYTSRYGGDIVLRFEIHSAADAKALADAVEILFLDVWESTTDWTDIRLSKDVLPSLLGLLPGTLQHARPLMHDLALTILESYPANTILNEPPAFSHHIYSLGSELRSSRDNTNIFFQNYQPLAVLVPWMRLLCSLYPTHVRMLSIGKSYEGREIYALRVGVHPTNSEKLNEPRRTIIVAGGSHAREWITTSTVTYVTYSFVTAYGRDKAITKLLENFDIIFIPTLNPDGYVYTFENDRLWRKNRQSTTLRFCKGFDLDRTFDFGFDAEAGSNSNPCSESFSGETPFEAVEARRFRDFVHNETRNNNVQIVGYLDLHSYSQQILHPFSYSCIATPPNLENLEELAIGLAKAIRLSHGETYGIASACEGIIPDAARHSAGVDEAKHSRYHRLRMESGGGSALDWMYHEMKTQFAFQLKLRDTGSYGFLLPSTNIVPTGKEVFKAVQYFGQFLLDHLDSEDRISETHQRKIQCENNADSGQAKDEIHIISPEL